MYQNLSSAAVVIGALRVKLGLSFHLLVLFMYVSSEGSVETADVLACLSHSCSALQ